MQNTKIRALIYKIKHDYFTLNNAVLVVALLIAASWVWGALGMMQRNYALQKEVDFKHRQLQLIELQTENLALQQRYFETDEYKEIELRKAGLVMPGERLLVVKSSSNNSATNTEEPALPEQDVSNLAQWANFLFGGYSRE